MSTSRLFMVRVSTGAEPFEATARCVEHEPIRRFSDPLQLLEFLKCPDDGSVAPGNDGAAATGPPTTQPPTHSREPRDDKLC